MKCGRCKVKCSTRHCQKCLAYYRRRRESYVEYGPVPHIPSAQVIEWLNSFGIPDREIANRIARHSGTPDNWARAIKRLRRSTKIKVWAVDIMCVALGEHISRFDPLYQEQDEQEEVA